MEFPAGVEVVALVKGVIRVVWTADGETIKDETIPHAMSKITEVGDSITVTGIGHSEKLEITFHFDPPLECP